MRPFGTVALLCGLLLACAGAPRARPSAPAAPAPVPQVSAPAPAPEVPSLGHMWLAAPDSVRQQTSFPLYISLVDGRGAPLVGTQRVQLRTGQQGVHLEQASVLVENGRARASVRAETWSGSGLYLTARCLVEDGTQLISTSNPIVVLPAR